LQTRPAKCQSSAADQYFQQGNAAFKSGHYDEAIANYTKVIQINPKDAAGYSNRGVAYAIKHLYDKAFADLNKALELDPTDDSTLVNRGTAYRGTGQYDKAIADFEEALFFNSENAAARHNLDDVRKLKAEGGSKATGQSQSEQPKGGDVWEQIIKDAIHYTSRNTKSGGANSEQATQQLYPYQPGKEFWCDAVLKTPFNNENLPLGYSQPQISSTEMTAEELASGMLCKISVALHGPDAFNAIRFRFFRDNAAAERGLKSLAKMVPSITVIDDKVSYKNSHGDNIPCMVYTTGNQPVTFVTCAEVGGGRSNVVSGVSSQPRSGNSYNRDAVGKAGRLLDAGMKHWGSIMFDNIEQIAKDVFGPDEKK
jgi:hypothetical protein